jgi:hypothetical protein
MLLHTKDSLHVAKFTNLRVQGILRDEYRTGGELVDDDAVLEVTHAETAIVASGVHLIAALKAREWKRKESRGTIKRECER